MTEGQISDMITKSRTAATTLLQSLDDYLRQQRKLDASKIVLKDDDFKGENAGIPATDFAAAMAGLAAINTAAVTGKQYEAVVRITN